MYVINPQVLNLKTLYSCNKVISDWLGTKQIPFISHDEIKGIFYYVQTKNLEEALEKMPLNIKFLSVVL